ncbi:MAG TPA: nucleoside recognition domain-containing protein [Symbiobacteriaceae bacterium]
MDRIGIREVAPVLNGIWLFLMVVGVAVAAHTGKAQAVTDAAFAAARLAIDTMIGLAGLNALWMGLMKIAERSGLMEGLAWLLRPLVRWLFPSVPRDHPAVGAILMNISANMLGLGSAATPMGLKAMQELQRLNDGDKETATEAMCTFLALNTSCITLIPGSIIALRAASGSANPAEIVGATLIASTFAGVVGILLDWLVRQSLRARGR